MEKLILKKLYQEGEGYWTSFPEWKTNLKPTVYFTVIRSFQLEKEYLVTTIFSTEKEHGTSERPFYNEETISLPTKKEALEFISKFR